jgi:hypothetical protein
LTMQPLRSAALCGTCHPLSAMPTICLASMTLATGRLRRTAAERRTTSSLSTKVPVRAVT